jgi:Domain of unknown function (DUF4912)/Tetratricopeptide repeat
MERQDLERMNREQLIAQAERLGIPRPRVLTQPELIDELIARTTKNERERAKARGWLGHARDLLARVVEKGLHLPEAARALRGGGGEPWPAPPPPLPTVTLAEIYAAQGHFDRAIAVLDDVIAREPDHREAKSLRARFVEQAQRSRSRLDRAAAAEAHEADRNATPAAKAPHAKAKPTEAPPPADPPAPPSEVEAPPTETSASGEPPAGDAAPPPASDQAEPSVEMPATEPAPAQVSPPVPAVAEEGEEPVAPTVTAGALVAVTAVVVAEAPVAMVVAEAAVPPAAPAVVEEPVAAEPPAVVEEPVAAEPLAAVEEPVALPLADPPLPQRYEVDEVVAIAVDPRTIYVYWEVRPTTLAHVRASHPGGALNLRIASVTASWEGPRAETRDLHVDSLYGDRFIRDIRPGSLIRVSVGWKSDAGFEPLAVGDELSAPRMLPVDALTHDVVRWEPAPVAPFQDPRVEAVEAARVEPPGEEAAPSYRAPVRETGPTTAVRAFREGAPSRAFEQRVAAARIEAEGRGEPVDTGVASFRSAVFVGGQPPREEYHDEDVAEAPWLEPGGASELARGLRRRRVRRLIPGVPGHLAFGPPGVFGPPGASELSRGGASELSRDPRG